MDDTQQNFKTREMPSILQVKPVEQLKPQKIIKVDENSSGDEFTDSDSEIEDLKQDEIFKKPVEQPKKKKQLSERQKAHMKKMNEARKRKNLERKQKLNSQKKVPVKQAPKKQVPVQPVQPVKQDFTGHKPAGTKTLSNQEYLQQFFNNMNMFMDSAQKLQKLKPNNGQPNPTMQPKKNYKKNVPKAPQKQTKTSNDSYYVDFLKPKVSYNYKNPFGF